MIYNAVQSSHGSRVVFLVVLLMCGCLVWTGCGRKDDHSSAGGADAHGLVRSQDSNSQGIPRSTLTSPDGGVHRGDLGRAGSYNASGPNRFQHRKHLFTGTGRALGSPAVFGGMAFFGTTAGFFYAVNAETGAEKWRFLAGAIASSPGVAGDYVYFGADDGHLYAMNASTGKEVWRFKTRGRVQGAPVVYKGAVYFGSMDGFLYALDADTGALMWKAGLGAGHVEPAIADGRIFARSGEFLVALDVETGRVLWTVATGGCCQGIAVVSGTVLTLTGRSLHAFEAETGQVKWTFEAEEEVRSTAPIATADGIVFFPDGKGNLYAVYIDTGGTYWTKETDGSGIYLLSVAGGTLYYVTSKRDLRAMNFRFPQEVWRSEVGDVHAGPVASGRSVYLLLNGINESGLAAFNE